MNSYSRFFSYLGLSAALLPTAISCATKAEAKKQKPNILFIFTDDHRYDAVHTLGGTPVKTPHLDSIIDNGVSFNNAYLQGANTGATSSASRAQLLTGRGVFNIPNGNGSAWSTDIPTFAETFRDAGYHTFITGKSDNGPKAPVRGFVDGDKLYGLYHGFYKPHFRLAYVDFKPDGDYKPTDRYFVGGENHELKITPSEESTYVGPHSTDIFADAALKFLKGYNEDKPFMLYLAFHAPHDTRNYPDSYEDCYDPEKMLLPDNFLPEHPFDNGDLKVRDECLAPFPRTESDTKSQIADYYRLVTHVDDRVGDIMAMLKERGFDDNTIIVFSSDSGLGMGSHGLFGKQNVYDDAGMHVPMVFSGPGIPRGVRQDDLCYNCDIYPTMCDLAGVEIPETVLGHSQIKSVMGKSENFRDEIYLGYMDTQRAVRDGRYKLIEYCVDGARHTQLFDLKNDRNECHDLASDPAYADKVAYMRERLVAHAEMESDNTWGAPFWETFMKSYNK